MRLHLRKPPPASIAAPLSTSVLPTPFFHGDHNRTSAPVSIPLSSQSPPAVVITPLMDTTEARVDPLVFTVSSSQTPSPPAQALLSPAPINSNIKLGGAQSEMQSNPWQPACAERADPTSAECMSQVNRVFFTAGHFLKPPPSPPKSVQKGKGKDFSPSLLVSQVLAAGARDAGSSSSVVGTSTAFERPTQDTAWDFDVIFANDLTSDVMRKGEYPIASGGYGDIYRGTLRRNGTSVDVAVKAIRTYCADDGDDAQKKKRLHREIKVWTDLKHINVLPLFGTTMGFGRLPAMVCPWREHGPLTSYLERRDDNLTVMERLTLLGDVAMGLQYLHSRSVVHGDLSGSNVLIHGDGRACIADFGLSVLLTALGVSPSATSPQVRGTLRWAAPELLCLNVQPSEEGGILTRVQPTPRSDIYSFGRIMLQILTGKIPYHYYPRDERVVIALSQKETPARPHLEVITERRWVFIQQCWSTVNEGQSRPSDEEIVGFTRDELAGCRKTCYVVKESIRGYEECLVGN
ncbi:kinase-like protein [Gyrodon lividus]|nr:kinase-like protein [Gyrodon lividus]